MARVPIQMVTFQIGGAEPQIILPGQQQIAVDLRVVRLKQERAVEQLRPGQGFANTAQQHAIGIQREGVGRTISQSVAENGLGRGDIL